MGIEAGPARCCKYLIFLMVPGAGIEPARLAAGDFESPASTNFTTRAMFDGALSFGKDQHYTLKFRVL